LVSNKEIQLVSNEQTGKEDCQTENRNHRHLPYSMWHIITESNNDYLTHLLKIGLDAIKREYKLCTQDEEKTKQKHNTICIGH
jgi:hypothetical protein